MAQRTTEWTPRDAQFLQRFLESDTGKKLIAEFKAGEPNMDDKTIEGRALQAAAYSNYKAIKDWIKGKQLVEKEPKEKSPYIDTSGLDVQ
jgi:hypothetical protein